MEFKIFDVNKVYLEGSNLVEASAGTGKTYSIAILTLRLILENKVPVREILMVTFTNAAVAELEIRIRQFVRAAYKYSLGSSEEKNKDVKDLVDKIGKPESQVLLAEAVRQLDETSILTIHSFCQNTLTEFAFETGQRYDINLLTDLSEVIGDEVKAFWRKEVTNIGKSDLIKVLYDLEKFKVFKTWYKYLSIDVLKGALRNELDNKNLKINSGDFDFDKSIEFQENEINNKMLNYIRHNQGSFILKINSHEGSRYTDNTRSTFISLLSDPQKFLEFILKTTNKNAVAIFETEIKILKELREKKRSVKKMFIENLIIKAIASKSTEIKQRMELMSHVSYDDLIKNLHQATVIRQNENLKSILRERYKAVFVDEFQDTDKYQYEIFNTLYNNGESVLFYIGDPKQSIYGWRKADINTYFHARKEVDNTYTMNTNFRSTQLLINGLNEIFSENSYQNNGEGVGLFHNEKESPEEKKIIYHEVDASSNTKQKNCYLNETIETPVTIYDGYTNKPNIDSHTINLIQNLLDNGVLREEKQISEKIKPSDIAILVRTGFEGRSLKEHLDKLGIPSVLIDDSKIFTAPETTAILYLLQAIQEPSSSAVNKALLSKLTGYSRTDIEKLNINFHLDNFKKLLRLFNSKGVYACLLTFYEDYHTRKNLLGSSESIAKSGLKSYSNLLQLADALQRIQKQRGYELNGLISFLKKANEGEEIEGDEYEQRIETDEEAIQISTIHSSKGLQYNIVIAPFLDLEVKTKGAFSSFRSDDGEYYFEPNYNNPAINNRNFKIQTEQENRRLIYVALTRAKYQLYVFTQRNGSMGAVLNNKLNSKYLVVKNYEPKEVTSVISDNLVDNLKFAEPKQFNLKDKKWLKMSFSFLSLPRAPIPKTFETENKDYDYFIFKELERGAHIGNLLHTIFEFIDFTNPEQWQKTIDINLKKYIPRKQELYQPNMNSLLNHILGASIHIPGNKAFRLNEIPTSKRINELEFDININNMNLSKLYDLQTDSVRFSFRDVDLNGILNGLIDLFFEHDNKYYILDWKSNYLGDSLDDYRPEKLNDAMNENNYHLQYYIYTMAAKRFLESKLDMFDYETQFGGVIYLFLRGMRTKEDTGIFSTKLSLETVRKMEEVFCLEPVE
ncbi:UvrD-helicase domain-containing protein [Gelidibacter maritimus]|uniref:RecBCD enzyme subunit RecB n=1 Tax=Gelidibacter maritimus TaxID=2761487 RepID=A0A7W2M2E3_9FLAO|nr:UvrD-helicase domain-containing protein [Gelidibacter maritimus]MBA6151458.1 UvrD-helicase domain-containing protein [Gelidibacter maritimus]